MSFPPVTVKVWGDFACFTRPEAKIERVSYEVPTPSAARGILEAIYWHPPMRWRIREIVVLKPIRHFSVLRNEVKERMSEKSDGFDISEERSQRHTLGLRDVAYVIKADVWLPPGAASNDDVKHRDQFRERVRKGQCFHRPYLGCREFACAFAEPDGSETPHESLADQNVDLGMMLFDIVYREGARAKRPNQQPVAWPVRDAPGGERRLVEGYAEAVSFPAKLEKGRLKIDPALYDKAHGSAGGTGR